MTNNLPGTSVSGYIITPARQGNAQFIKLLLVDSTRCIKHYITSAVVFREGDAVAYAIKTGKEAHKAVKSVGKTSMWGRTILEGIHEEAELCLCLFGRKAENVENLRLQHGIVDTNGSASHFNTIAHHVIGIGTNAGGVSVKKRDILGLW